MGGAGIDGIASYLPKRVITNRDLAEAFPGLNMARAERATGIKARHAEDASTPASDMAIRAAEALFEKIREDRNSIDFVIVVTQSADYRMPATACLVQGRAGLPKSAGAMDICQGCAGYIYGLATAKSFAESGVARKILLITVEKTSFFLYEKDSALRLLQGDAATATLISGHGRLAELGAFDFGTAGSGFAGIIVPYGGSAEPRERAAAEEGPKYAHHEFVNMKGLDVFNFSVETVPVTINAALRKNGLAPDDVDYFVFRGGAFSWLRAAAVRHDDGVEPPSV